MTRVLGCGCTDSGKGFRHQRKCVRDIAAGPGLQAELDRLERDDPAVAKASRGLDAVYGNVGGGLSQAELKAIYDPPEPRYLTTLSDGDGDLG